MKKTMRHWAKPKLQEYCEQSLVQDLSTFIYKQAPIQKDIKALYGYYVTTNGIMSHFNFVLQCVKVLIGMYPMSLVEAKAFVDNSLK